MAELTPMMQQYREIKSRNPDCLLFFRLGDFYEMFDEDAKLASESWISPSRRATAARRSRIERRCAAFPSIPPTATLPGWSPRATKVAICEQMEDPALAKGLVKRDIIRIVTPGTVTEAQCSRNPE